MCTFDSGLLQTWKTATDLEESKRFSQEEEDEEKREGK
jgi:hypothetical protein